MEYFKYCNENEIDTQKMQNSKNEFQDRIF